MAYRKKKWWEKLNWHDMIKACAYSALGSVVAVVTMNVQQKPSSRDLEAFQKNSNMTVTAYVETGAKTALGFKSKPGLHAAVSRDRLDLLGKKIYVMCGEQSLGIREVTDVMGDDAKQTIDLMVPTEKAAVKFGRINECEVVKLEVAPSGNVQH